MLLMFSLLPLLSGCDNEDDVIGIFTGKTWKLSRLTNKGSNAQFYPNLWNNNEEEMKKSLDKLYNQKSTFTLNFEGTELDGNTRAPKRRIEPLKHLSGGNRYEHYSRKAR